jgi:hypothetical protein
MYLTELCGREEVNFRLEKILTSNCVLLHHEHRIENFDGLCLRSSDRKENLAEKDNNAFLDTLQGTIHSFPSCIYCQQHQEELQTITTTSVFEVQNMK